MGEALMNVSQYCLPMFLFDNMDMVLHHLTQNFTLPVLVFRGNKKDLEGLPSDDAMNLEEKVEIYQESSFLITSDVNKLYLDAYTEVMYTVLTDLLTSNFSKFKWMRKFFPTHHDHPLRGHSHGEKQGACREASVSL